MADPRQQGIDDAVRFLFAAAQAYVDTGQLRSWSDAACALADAMMLAVARAAPCAPAVRPIYQKLVEYTETTVAETERAVVVRLNRLI